MLDRINGYHACVARLIEATFSLEDATALRRISMTLHRWHELECGDSNDYASWCITRGEWRDGDFHFDDSGKPHLETHGHNTNARTRYVRIPDRERGALKRLDKIMQRYPGFGYYVQGDPRGCALYIMRPGDIPTAVPGFERQMIADYYTRGIAVYK